MYQEEVRKLQEIIDDSRRIVFFGGAGVSTESGIPDFRSADGIYHQHYKYAPEQVVSHSFFKAHPDVFYEFYKEKMMCLDAQPNAAHRKLAELEEAGRLTAVITQNIDGLHQKAGSKKVYELHGSIHRNYCQKCGRFYDAAFVKETPGIPRCECGGLRRRTRSSSGAPPLWCIRRPGLLIISAGSTWWSSIKAPQPGKWERSFPYRRPSGRSWDRSK